MNHCGVLCIFFKTCLGMKYHKSIVILAQSAKEHYIQKFRHRQAAISNAKEKKKFPVQVNKDLTSCKTCVMSNVQVKTSITRTAGCAEKHVVLSMCCKTEYKPLRDTTFLPDLKYPNDRTKHLHSLELDYMPQTYHSGSLCMLN